MGFDPDILGAIFFEQKQIVIDENLDPDANSAKEGRYLYIAAYEVGHWRLHRGLFGKDPAQTSLLDANTPPRVICRTSQAKARIELQADLYASCLLIPRKLVFAARDQAFPDRTQRVLQPSEPIDHPFVEIARFEGRIPGAAFTETTIRRWKASLRPSPKSSTFRRSRCASGSKSSGSCTAWRPFSGFRPMARDSFF